MTSKSSFLVSMKENSKRRLWVWVVSVLGFVLILPLFTALRISTVRQQTEQMIAYYGAELGGKIVHENLLDAVKGILGSSEILLVLTVLMAVISAVQGFSWLYSRKKIDFYVGMPVKRSKRFLVIWMNGILIYLIPYLAGLFIAMLIAAGSHGLDGEVFKVIIQTLFVNLVMFLCIYHLAILAVMLTGNLVITGMGFLVFCLYEWLVRRADHVYKSRFFRYYTSYSNPETMLFSPFTMYSDIISNLAAMADRIQMFLWMLVFATLAGALGFWAYMKRPAEGAGKAMVFDFTKPIIKILLVVPMALVVADMIANDVNYAPEQGLHGGGYVLLALALTTILGCAVIQVLYEFDISGAIHKKRHILISGILVTLLFASYRYDLLHYDSYVPDVEDVESVAFYPAQYDNADYKAFWFEPEGVSVFGAHVNQHMYLTDTADVCALAEYSMENYNKEMNEYENEGHSDDLALVSDTYWSEAVITYRLKGGREIMRRLWVDVNDETTAGYLDRIIGSAEFKEGYFMGASDRLSQAIEENEQYKISAYYGNLVYEQKLTNEELSELLACYQTDMESYNFTKVKESSPVGMLRIEFEKELSKSARYIMAAETTELGMNIYPFFENSIDCLKQYGFYMERQADVADIDRIYITNHNSKASEKLWEIQRTEEAEAALNDQEVTASYPGDTRVYANYTQRDDIEQIADYIYAQGMLSHRWDDGISYDPDYEVMVYFKAESDMSRKYGTTAYYLFREGEIPDFVKEDTAFQLVENN